MNVAAFNVAAMNIPHIIHALHLTLQRSTFFSVYFALGLLLFHKFCCVTAHDEIFGICLFLVIQFLRFPRSIGNRLSVPYGMRISAEKRFDEEQLVA